MAKWEAREARQADEKRKEDVASLRERMGADDGKARKQQAEMTAREAVAKGIGHRG